MAFILTLIKFNYRPSLCSLMPFYFISLPLPPLAYHRFAHHRRPLLGPSVRPCVRRPSYIEHITCARCLNCRLKNPRPPRTTHYSISALSRAPPSAGGLTLPLPHVSFRPPLTASHWRPAGSYLPSAALLRCTRSRDRRRLQFSCRCRCLTRLLHRRALLVAAAFSPTTAAAMCTARVS